MMMPDSLPRIKRFLKPAHLSPSVFGFLVRLMAAFLLHVGRMSATQAAGAIRSDRRHRAAVIRFLARLGWSDDWSVLERLAALVLKAESRRGSTWVFIVDPTYCGQQGQKTENTFSRGNYRKRLKKGNRKNKKRARRCCHCLVLGLLLTPSGLRLPSWRPYYTKAYCAAQGKPYRTQTALAAELIGAVVVPEGAEVVVLGDTAFEAKSIRAACAARSWSWIVPVNPERVLAGPKPRRKVRSLVTGLTAGQFAPVRLVPGQGAFAAMRRVAPCRLGPKVKPRTYYVHRERRDVHSVGEVQLVFSTKEKPKPGKPVVVQKILMTNDQSLAAADVVERYDLRWQIELLFKELKGTLGLHQYRFRSFAKVESWVATCLVSFLYLEWYRTRQLQRRDLTAKEKHWWRWQRTHGLCAAIRLEVAEAETIKLAAWTRTPAGRKKLKKYLRAALPKEYQKTG